MTDAVVVLCSHDAPSNKGGGTMTWMANFLSPSVFSLDKSVASTVYEGLLTPKGDSGTHP